LSSRHVKQIDSSDDRIIIDAEFQNLSPESLFDYFTVPGLLERWWPSLAEVDPRIAGTYHFSWPKQGWHLRGSYTDFERGKRLGFSWKWDHEPSDNTNVSLIIETLPRRGSHLVLNHGSYSVDEEGRKRRQGHIDGWMHFLERLQSSAH